MKLPRFLRRKQTTVHHHPVRFTDEEIKKMLDDAYQVGYNDGRKDGIAVSRKIATDTLKEVIWQQTNDIQTQR